MIVFSLPTSEQALFENLSSRSNWTRGHNASLITANPSLFYDGLGFKAPRLVIMACGEFHYERERRPRHCGQNSCIHEVNKKNFHKKGENFKLKIYERFRYLFGLLLKRNTRFSHIKSSSLFRRKVSVKCGDDRGSIWLGFFYFLKSF